MNRIITLLLFSLSFFFAHAQNAVFDSVTFFDGSGQLEASQILIDSSGNTILIGTYYNKVDLNPSADSAIFTGNGTGSYSPTFIVKLDANGNYLWSGVLPTTTGFANFLQLDANNNIYVAGMFEGTIDFDFGTGTTTKTSVGPTPDGFVMKINASGAFQWVKTFGQAGQIQMKDFVLDHAGNMLFSGACEGGNIVFHPDATSPTTNAYTVSFFVLKYNANGTFAWVNKFGASGQYDCHQIEVTANNDVLVGGHFYGTIDFDPSSAVSNLTSQGGSEDIFIVKFSPTGSFAWVKKIGNGYSENLVDMKVDDFDNLILTGNFNGTVDFNPNAGTFNETSAQSDSKFILKLDAPTANFKWVRSFVFTDPYNVLFKDLHIDNVGNVYTTGHFKREFYVHPDTTVNNTKLPSSSQAGLTSYDAFIHKLDSAGNYQWARSVHASNFQRGKAVTTNAQNQVFWLGDFTGIVDFGLDGAPVMQTASGNFDLFLLRMNQCLPSHTPVTDSVCQLYISALGDTILQSGNYQIVFPNAATCDSIVDLNLFVNQLNNGVALDSSTLQITALQNNTSYQWVDCAADFSPIAGAVAQQFTPSANGNYAVILSENGCVDTSNCIEISTIGLLEMPKQSLRIYPNPTTGILKIKSAQQLNQIKIIDVNGREVYHSTQVEETIDVSHLPVGIYYLRASGEKYTLSKKIIVL